MQGQLYKLNKIDDKTIIIYPKNRLKKEIELIGILFAYNMSEYSISSESIYLNYSSANTCI